MNSKNISEGILRAIAIIGAIVLLLWFLYQVRSVIAYITIAAVTALIGRPVVVFLRSKLKFNNTLAVIVTMILLIGALAGIVALFIPLLVQQGQNLSLLNIEALQNNVENLYHQIATYFGFSDAELTTRLQESKIFVFQVKA